MNLEISRSPLIPPKWGLGLSCLRDQQVTRSFTPAPSYLGTCPQPREATIVFDLTNLEYLQSTKTLNSLQVLRWSLFMSWFKYSLFYWLQHPDNFTPGPNTVHPSFHLVASLVWEMEEMVRAALEDQTRSCSNHQDHLFIPLTVRSEVLQWSHSPATPGSSRLKMCSSEGSGGHP